MLNGKGLLFACRINVCFWKMKEVQQKKVRKAWIDALRAVAILFVVYGHRARTLPYLAFVNPIKMPLFFALSGYLFKIREGGDKVFFKKLFFSLVVPWLCLGLVPLLFAFPFKGVDHSVANLVAFFCGKIFWFMPCFIVGEIFFYYTVKLCRNNTVLMIVTSLVFAVVGYFLKRYGLLDFMLINIAMTVQPYFLMGFLYRRFESKISKTLWWGLALVIAYFVLGWIFYPQSRMDVHYAAFSNLPLCSLMTFIGLLALFMLAPLLKYPKWLLAVGKNSLVIYMLDRYALIPFAMVFDFKHYPVAIIASVALIYLIWSAGICILAAKVINRFAPWVTGNRG